MNIDHSRRDGDMNRSIRKALAGAAALVVLAAVGCTDLIVEPKSTVNEANAFKDPSSYRAFLAKLYAGLSIGGQTMPEGQPDIQGINEGFSSYLRLFWEHQELPTDEAVIAWGDLGLPEMNTQLWAVDNQFVVAMYYRIFFQVSMANEFLRQTTAAKLAERGQSGNATLVANIVSYRAEARFLRALSYWHGLDMFGNIPLYTEADVVGVPPQQATRTQIYDFIVSELTGILGDLPASGPANYGRATVLAAQMLLAKVYMNAQVYTGTPHYTEAMTAITAVIAGPYTLNPVWRKNFLADNNTSAEIIFAITQDGVHTQTWGGMTFLIHAACGRNMNLALYGINGCWEGFRMKNAAYSRYAAGDTARTSYFFGPNATYTDSVAAIGTYTNGIPAPKFANVTSTGQPGSSANHPDTDFPMFRLADALLMYAELHLRGGGGSAATALGYVNSLRQRSYGGTSGDITAPQLTLDFILDERGRELLSEGHRRTDLIRFDRFTGGTSLWEWKGNVRTGTSTAAYRNLYPIPANELIANPNLKQNPGY
jgi:hypothetical protein